VFADACTKAQKFTRPLISSFKFLDGSCSAGVGTYVIINPDGWFITAGHNFEGYAAFKVHSGERGQIGAAISAVNANQSLKPKERRRQLSKFRENPKWIEKFDIWFGDGVRVSDVKVFPEIDLAVGRVIPTPQGFEPPVIGRPGALRPGTSLCRLGFPFIPIQCTFDDAVNKFNLGVESGLELFPNEGIMTREVTAGKTADGKFEKLFIETSSAGLRGQSGGPLFDIHGQVWGIQLRTAHLALGFAPKAKDSRGNELEAHQFLNVGWAAHTRLLVDLLNEVAVSFQAA